MKNFNEYSKATYDSKSDHYDRTFDGKFTKSFKDMLCNNMMLKENSVVLDIACGNGILLKMLSEKQTIQGHGIDISDGMITNAIKNCGNMTFKVAGCESIPFGSGLFDIITVCAAYHHFPDVKSFAAEASRVITGDGYLYVSEVYLPTLLRVILNPFIPLSKAGDVKFYSPDEIVSNFEAYGFRRHSVVIRGHIQIVCMQKKS